MAKARSLVGLDVHAAKIVAAFLDAETGQLQTFSMSGDTDGTAGFACLASATRPDCPSMSSYAAGHDRSRFGSSTTTCSAPRRR